MGRVTIRKGRGVVYESIGWKKCSCGRMGFWYRWKGKVYVKHPAPAEQQMRFTDLDFSKSLWLEPSVKQAHCAPLVRGRR
ncbi:MAG: hypothetical protein ACREAW_10680 [Nitrososphaera sp.]